MRSKGYLFRACYVYSKGNQSLSLAFDRDTKADRGEGSLQVCPDEDHWLEKLSATNQKWGALCNWVGVHMWLSLVDPKLGAEQKLKKLSVSNGVLAV